MVDSPADDTTNDRQRPSGGRVGDLRRPLGGRGGYLRRPLGGRGGYLQPLGSAVAAFGLLLIVCLGPLPYGSVLVRERSFLQICAFLALAAILAGRWRGTLPGRSMVPPAMIAAVGLWGIVQSLPWPRFVAELLAPGIVDVWDQALPSAAAVPLSLAPAVSRAVGFHWLAIAAAMGAASLVGADRRARRLVIGGFLAVAVFEIFFGAEKWLGRSDVLWGLEVAGGSERLRGTFINANHLAFYLTTAVAVVLSWLWWSVRRVWRRGKIELLLLILIPGLGFLVLFAGIAFSGSRAGLVASVVAILAYALLLATYYRRWLMGLLAVGVVGVGLGGMAFFGLQQGLARWATTSAYEVTWSSRFEVYRGSWELWRSSPWTGTGLGTFRQAFPSVQPAEVGGIWIHAHSDVLEFLATAGIVVLPLVAWGLYALLRHLTRAFRQGRRSEDRAAALGALVALTGAGVHSTVDFALTIPANAFTLAVLCGLACGVAAERRPG